jgi:DNA-binding NarL/FixJ family response regulator
MKTIRVYIVDDERLVREGLRMRLGMERDLSVVGEAVDGESALRDVPSARPDVVVMDVELPSVDGIETARALLAASPGFAVVMLSMHDDAGTRARAAANGAVGFVSKHATDDSLLEAIRAAGNRANGHGGRCA